MILGGGSLHFQTTNNRFTVEQQRADTMFTSLRPVAAKAWRAASSLPATSLRLSSRVPLARRQFIVVPGRSSVLSARGFANQGRPPKKAAAKKTTAKKAVPKKKKKKVVAKPKPKKVKKVVTPEEKQRLEKRDLRAIALLNEPTRLPDSAWLVYTSQHIKNQKIEAGTFGNTMKTLGDDFRALYENELRVSTTSHMDLELTAC